MDDLLESALLELAQALRERNWRLATAESCTGGGLAKVLTDLPGSSEWFECGWVTYSNAAKTRLLGVPEDLIQQHGAVSEAVAAAMAQGALSHSAADLAVAITGIAGPGGGSLEKPVGLVWLAWAERQSPGLQQAQIFPGNRQAVRSAAIAAAIAGLLRRAQNNLSRDCR